MPKRAKAKLSKMEIADNEVVRWTAKRDAAIKMLGKAAYNLQRAEKAKARLAKKLLAEKMPPPKAYYGTNDTGPKPKRKVTVPKPKVTETTDIPNAEVFGEKLEAAIKTELQAANNRLASAWNDSVKGPLKAKGGEPSKEQVAAEKAKRMKAAGFHPAKR